MSKSSQRVRLTAPLTDPQAKSLWQQVAADRRARTLLEFENAVAAVAYLDALPGRRRRATEAKRGRGV